MTRGIPGIESFVLLLFVLTEMICVSCTESVEPFDDEIMETASNSDIAPETAADTESEKEEEVVLVDVIDDMESGSGRIFENDGRIGVWYVFNDGIVEQWPPLTEPGEPALTDEIVGGRGGSTRAMHTLGRGIMTGCDYDCWGAGIGVDLMYDGLEYKAYDASAYSGLTFWGLSDVPMAVPLLLGTVDDVAIEWGGFCPIEQNLCISHPTTYVPFMTAWKQYWVFFSSWEGTVALNELLNVQFFFHRYNDVDAFNFWIDDLAFFSGNPDCDLPDTTCLFQPGRM